VGLVVEVEAVVDQLVEIDFGRAFGAPVSTSVASGASIAAISAWAVSPWTSITSGPWRPVSPVAVALLRCLLICHVYPISIDITSGWKTTGDKSARRYQSIFRQARPFQRN
jgi:hypothetical protein